MLRIACLLFVFTASALQPASAAVTPRPSKTTRNSAIPFSTKSAEAREALQEGVVRWENHRMAEAVESYRKAIQADPDFAVAHLYLSTLSPRPEEQGNELKKALALRSAATGDEQLLIDWLASTSQNQILPAIASMNELLGRYPEDKHLLYRAAIWFRNQRQLSRSVALYERLLKLDPEFADALNQLGYIYAFQADFDKAVATMKKYVAVLPHEPNPEDSYAEILRMAGRYEEAIAHYHRALEIEPTFWMSQEGIAGTYSLMGDQARARTEYAKAIEHAPSQATALLWTMNSAVTWVRESNYENANAIYREAADRAHQNQLAELESTAYRMMSLYEKDTTARLALLDKAEAALHEDHPLSKLTTEQQTALIMRARIYADLDAGNVTAAAHILEQLRAATEKTHNGFIQVTCHGAAGAVLTMQGKYEDAIGELLEDDRNPYSLKYLVLAYQKNGTADEASHWAARITNLRNPTLEQALVTESFHEAKVAASN